MTRQVSLSYVLMLFCLLGAKQSSLGQSADDTLVVYANIINGDTIPIIQLDEIEVYSLQIIQSKRQQKKLSKLIRNIKKVYPYARLAGMKLEQYSDTLMAAQTKKERQQIMKQLEKEIEDEYGEELRNLTFSQGKILLKLIDRETGSTSYVLVQELRGNFRAFFYQTFARIWGYNLKEPYDPEGKDRQIEIIVRMIETGRL